MGDKNGSVPASVGGGPVPDPHTTQDPHKRVSRLPSVELTPTMSPTIPMTPNPFSRKNTSIDIDDYFTGPRDISKHSKWPLFLQMHGSILPKMLVPLIVVGAWATCITCITKLVNQNVGISSVLLTVLGFVVGLGLSFRSSTAYERYGEGRRYWATLILASHNLARLIWIHCPDAAGKDPRQSVLRKISSLNLILAFSIALKHKLRFEPYTAYDDLEHLVAHLHTFAKDATAVEPEKAVLRKKGFFKETGEYLGLSFAASNPRKTIKQASRPLGNLPLEILSYLAVCVDKMVEEGQLKLPVQQTVAYNALASLNDVLTGTERVLTTPLPIAYSIAINQITWVYVMILPFQLQTLNWIAIPATVVAAYIILGILFIGREIENPFGEDVNDLPLEAYCEQLAQELDVIASFEKRDPFAFMESNRNLPLYPISMAPYSVWMERSEDRVRDAIHNKTNINWDTRKKLAFEKHEREEKMAHGDHNV